jgi:hypothetical protein
MGMEEERNTHVKISFSNGTADTHGNGSRWISFKSRINRFVAAANGDGAAAASVTFGGIDAILLVATYIHTHINIDIGEDEEVQQQACRGRMDVRSMVHLFIICRAEHRAEQSRRPKVKVDKWMYVEARLFE